MRRIALLGTGYIGKPLVESLKAKGFSVRVSTTSSEKVRDLEKFTDEVFTLRGEDYEKVKRFLDGCDILIITVAPKDRSTYESTYLETAKTIADVKPIPRQIIYTSSTSVYGDHNGDWVDEGSAPIPDTPSGKILLDTETIYLSRFPKETGVCILRLGGILGPGREIISRIKRFEGKKIPGNGMNYTNLIHRDDVISAIEWSIEKNLTGVYNLVNDNHITRKELYSQLASRHQLPEVLWDETQKSPHAGNKRVSNARIKSTGFKFSHVDLIS